MLDSNRHSEYAPVHFPAFPYPVALWFRLRYTELSLREWLWPDLSISAFNHHAIPHARSMQSIAYKPSMIFL